jgi:hypothetical protein
MKKSGMAELCEGPSQHRRQHTPFTRDVLRPLGAPIIARHRTRTILTPLEVRRAILEDVASKPEAVRVRSLRRRLTILDRMLTDQEAEALERLTTCINSLSNVRSINYLKPEVRYTPLGRVPFSEKRRREISAMSYVLKSMSPPHRAACLELAVLLDPNHSGSDKPADDILSAIWVAASEVVRLYNEWHRSERQASLQ